MHFVDYSMKFVINILVFLLSDKSHKSNAAEDYYTVVGSKAGENTRDSDSICAIYDEPGDMMVYSQKAQTMEEGKENRSF